MYQGYLSRPPPLRTSCTYDDDEAFNNVAINLLSRHDTLGLTAQEAILATLFDPSQRASFYEGLCVRLDRCIHLSPNTTSLVQCLYEKLGNELKEMVSSESKGGVPYYTKKMGTPRGANNNSFGRNMKQLVQRRFFPDTTGSHAEKHQSPSSSGAIFHNKRRVQNIDWKMAEAIQQVNHLRLDGTSPPSTQQYNHKATNYEPPPSTRS